MLIELHGKNALVCGSSQGIGKAVAHQLASAGANITLLARNCEALRNVMSNLPNDGTQVHDYICSDIKDFDKIREELNQRIAVGKRHHILLNNTGGPAPGLLSEASEEDLADAFRTHVIAAQKITIQLLAGMKEEKYGRIINIISVGLKQPIDNLGVSNTIRGAMGSWAKTLASELGSFGITVNNILPGYTNTERLQKLIRTISVNENIKQEEVESNIVKNIPAGRLAEPAEIAYIVTFLASGLADYINGINLPVDGGYLRTL
jgi:3-oxoacyl-[acyl-carrier protein] reductase